MSSNHHAALAQFAVGLLSGPADDLACGAAAATRRHLSGLFLYGLSTRGFSEDRLPPATATEIRRSARREAADDAVSAREIGEILDILAARGLQPLVLKGRSLALELWPRPCYRPPGDLDLLLEREAVRGAVEALTAAGYHEPPVALRSDFSEAALLPPAGRLTPVDLHWHLFRSVGSGIDPERFLRRARPARLEGRPVRVLEDADQLLFLLVHAAKHGLRRLKWLLDLYALALRTDTGTWQRAVQRALASHSSRPFHLSAAFLAALPGVSIDLDILRPLAPARPIRIALARLVTLERTLREDPLSQREIHAFEILLEENLPARIRRAARLLRRVLLDRPRNRVYKASQCDR